MPEVTTVESINDLREEALSALACVCARDERAVEAWRVEYLGRRGRLTQILRELTGIPIEARREIGAAGNRLKALLEQSLAEKRLEAAAGGPAAIDALDITLPGRRPETGRLHPITQMVREICSAFVELGFQVVEGPEVEWDRYNFDLLNMPKDHPARDMWDTLWIDHMDEHGQRDMLLRTHTSPMQARLMEKTAPPVRVVVPGKCYRYEATDATHEWHFYQIEGLAVDEGISFANLKGTLYEFARRVFGQDRKVRFRCDFFPFVEPGAEMAIDCFACDGKGCRVCKQTGWLEILGAGMVHPNVLRAVGYDAERYTGFAFGMGVERIAMLKNGIDDIRNFYSNDMRFLTQF